MKLYFVKVCSLVALLFIGWLIFKKLQKGFAEEL